MKRFFHIVFTLLLAASLSSCLKEGDSLSEAEGIPVDVALHFGSPASLDVDVLTKTDMGAEAESKVWNIYVFIFDSSGEKFYGKYFDSYNLDNPTLSDYWEVSNLNGTSIAQTTGTVHLHTVTKDNCTIVGITNIDSDMVNISPEQLGTVTRLSQLTGADGLLARMNQPIVERTGYFPMSGKKENVNVKSGGIKTATTPESDAVLQLHRLDAKIVFNIKVGKKGDETLIKAFHPDRWAVYNVPHFSYVLEHAGDATDAAAFSGIESKFFSLSGMNFHSQTVVEGEYYARDEGEGSTNPIIQSSFAFYMMENRKDAKADPGSWVYKHRELQAKDPSAPTSTSTTNGSFVYAPDWGTYVKFGGFVEMAVPSGEPLEGKTLSADVEYIVHLGDFSGNQFQNFDIERNHTYIYNITIVDVNDIRVEVENNCDSNPSNNLDENEPGATGQVTISKEEIFECDAHYCSYVITFHYKHIKEDVESVTWYVKTPFNKDGFTPIKEIINGEEKEFYEGFADYQWVEFKLNDRDPVTGDYREDKRQKYHPDETMNIVQLVRYLKQQTRLRMSGEDSDYDTPGNDEEAKICVTAFVNEYYYEENPLTHKYEEGLWKKVVNQPMRYMHILAGVDRSADGESKAITASFTIRQKSIQSIYNTENPDLQSAWGCEHFDDDKENQGWPYGDGKDDRNRGNTDMNNGRSNTLKEWGLISDNLKGTITEPYLNQDPESAPARAKWENYLDLEAANITPLMKDNYKYIRYSCMSRNRDNNGNGVIDLDEVRWYMGATNQLYGLFLGSYGIEGDAKLYQRNIVDQRSDDKEKWRQHVLSSSRYEEAGNASSNAHPRLLWAEEGITGSSPTKYSYQAGNEQTKSFSTRCVRNLGSYTGASGAEDITHAPYSVTPDDYITIDRYRKNGTLTPLETDATWQDGTYYDVDCSRINKASIRYFTSKELDFTDEFQQAACLPEKFRIAAKEDNPEFEKSESFEEVNAFLNSSIGVNPYCPPGYRLPNVREMAVMRYFLPETTSNISGKFFKDPSNNVFYAFTRTYWSFGLYGETGHIKMPNKSGWGAYNEKILMCDKGSKHSSKWARCVKDLE